MLKQLYEATIGRLLDARIRRHLLFKRLIIGDPTRVSIAPSALVNNALFNVMSGRITVEDDAFFGQNVCLLTGTHDIAAPKHLRKSAIPSEGRDIVIGAGSWVATNATIIGPARVGELAVVAAGAVVTGDVPPGTIVAGVPARVIGEVPRLVREGSSRSPTAC